MKIAFFNRSYWPDQAATGQLLTELAEDLVAHHGCNVSVVAGRALHGGTDAESLVAPRRGQELPLSFFTREERHGVRIVRANGTRLHPRRFPARAANYLTYFATANLAALALGPQDIVVSLTDPPIIGLAALAAARRAGARFVFLCEDIFPEVGALVDDFHNGAVNRMLDRINRYLLGEADAVVALGDRMRRRLVEDKGADPARVQVIHNWADCHAIEPGPRDNPFAREHGLVDRFVLMHSGNIGLSQNLDVLVEAVARLRSKDRLTVAIVGNGNAREALEARVQERSLTNVRFFPYQAKERLHESFATADVFLISLKPGLEGYIVPSKLYGILAAGRPYVAATDPTCEAATIALEHQCGVMAAPGDPDDLARAIAALYDAPDAAREMGERGRRAAWRYDRRTAVNAYYQLFNSMAGLAADRAASQRAAGVGFATDSRKRLPSLSGDPWRG